jgi:LppP/LprE lipoprotein
MNVARPLAFLLCFTAAVTAQPTEDSWLDRPLTNWNAPAKPVPQAMPTGETIREVAKRCHVSAKRDTPAQRALADAGWLPYLHVDREIVQRDVEIVAGMTEADGMCRPMDFNIFVFVGGQLAGTLSPSLMTSRGDGAIGAVRLAPDDTMAAEFARYADRDALCCPSSRVTVRYRIDRTGPRAVVVPVSVHVTRP